MDPGELVSAVRADLAGALIGLDFDGTIAPIVVDPSRSRPLPGVIDALIALAQRGAHVAIITGRDARTVMRLGGLDAIPRLTVAGLYGAEVWAEGELSSPGVPAAIHELRGRLPVTLSELGADPGLWIEDKRLSLVVHARRLADPDAALRPLREPLAELAVELGLQLHPGRDVLEFRIPDFDKGRALRALIEKWDPTTVLFAGDDVGDLPAFTEIRVQRARGRAAWSVWAVSAEVADLTAVTDVIVDGPPGVLGLLGALSA